MNQGITTYTYNKPFTTESGFTFPKLELVYKTWGDLNEDRTNIALVCHAFSGHAAADEWLSSCFGDGQMLDPSRHFILCVNIIGSCYGSTGPRSINPDTGKPYGSAFPKITIRDMVRAQQIILDKLEIKEVEFAFGASMGGMQALEFAIMDERVKQLVLVAMGKSHSPWAIGISEAQRQAIYADANWNHGDYMEHSPPVKGLAAARMMAMLTYRSAHSFDKRFSRDHQEGSDLFKVESYLRYQGLKMVERFDAMTYVRLTEAMDSHDVARGRDSYKSILGRIKIPALVIGIDSDLLYPITEQEELANLLGNGYFVEMKAPDGHDSFLIEFNKMQQIVKEFRNSHTLSNKQNSTHDLDQATLNK
ncbi:MAG: homoserine O-acetyltransferase [Balneolales bacterium]